MELPSNAGDGELLPMEEHKERALRHLLRRSKRPLEEFVAAVADVAEQLGTRHTGWQLAGQCPIRSPSSIRLNSYPHHILMSRA
uniref:Uncharacterized protein n=1 Tax=Zea mays TaxID=4577 RepID=A0A804PTZ5_MAIZE